MAEKSERGDVAPVLKLMLVAAVEEALAATDPKALSVAEGKARAVAAMARACGMIDDLTPKEDNMNASEHEGDEGGVARTNELRSEIERRLARIRAELESKAVAEDAGSEPA